VADSNEKMDEQSQLPMSRRDVVLGAAALATAAATARMATAAEHEGHHTGAPAAAHKYTEPKRYKKNAALVAASNECIARGQACISHCFETFLDGDTTMAECALSVEQMLRVCDAMAYLSAFDSKSLKPMAQACIAVCEDCEKECRVHEEHQKACRECADACAALIKEAKKVAA
jgi:Cys-rich four helix bundle protein (predicted Tat secretion target)